MYVVKIIPHLMVPSLSSYEEIGERYYLMNKKLYSCLERLQFKEAALAF